MKKTLLSLFLIFAVIFTAGCSMLDEINEGDTAEETISTSKKVGKTVLFQLELEDDEYDIYAPTTGNSWGYRYGPSAIVNADGSVDMWFSSLGTFDEADYILWRHSPDGKSWEDEKIALRPDPGSLDRFSCCDPGVVFFGGYYYIGYTSTIYDSGLCNNAFVARSTSPEGPYEKWNGSGWGGDASPIIRFDGDSASWGIGELSMVELDGTLYIYYTLRTVGGDFTMVATADSTSPNWCAGIKQIGTALKMGTSQSGADVKYCEDYGKFVAVATVFSFTEDSLIRVYTSDDGYEFTVSDSISTGVHKYSHNIGICGSPEGHLVSGTKGFISYAYGEKWGRWSTCLLGATVIASNEVDISDLDGARSSGVLKDSEPLSSYPDIGITTSPRSHTASVDEIFSFNTYTVNPLYRCTIIRATSDLTFSDWDENVISVDGYGNITALSQGRTSVTVSYESFSVKFFVTVCPNASGTDVISFGEVQKTYNVSLKEIYYKQIRAFAVCENGESGEAFNSASEDAFFPAADYPVKYIVADDSVAEVGETGFILPKKEGETTVTVSLGDFSFDVKVIVGK